MSEMTCQKCQRDVWLGNNDPTKYCDSCAHDIAEASDVRIATLERELAEAKALVERLKFEKANAASNAWLDIFCRFTSEQRGHIANLMAHEWTVDSVGISSRHNTRSEPQHVTTANKSAIQYWEMMERVKERHLAALQQKGDTNANG